MEDKQESKETWNKPTTLIAQLRTSDTWIHQLEDVHTERIQGVLLDKLIEYTNSQRAERFLNDMYTQFEMSKQKNYRLVPHDFIFCHNIRELDDQNIWKFMNYKELRRIIKGIAEIRNNSPYFRFIKHIKVPYRYTFNVTMINDLRYDLVLRLEDVKNKGQLNEQYNNILDRTINETTNPILLSKLKLWKEFINDEDLRVVINKTK